MTETKEKTDTDFMDEITKIMSDEDWNPSTLDYIAEVVKRSGRTIEDTPYWG